MSDGTQQEQSNYINSKNMQEEIEDIQDAVAANINQMDGVIIGDLWGYISDVNDVIVKMYGANDKSELVGKHVLEFIVKEERGRVVQDSLDSIIKGLGKKVEYRAKAKNGKELKLEVITNFIKDKQGEKIGFFDVVRDISNDR